MKKMFEMIKNNKDRLFTTILTGGLGTGTWYITNLGKQMSIMDKRIDNIDKNIDRIEIRMDKNMDTIERNMQEIRNYIFEINKNNK